VGFHVTARLAWHADGWIGRICREPEKNTYCIGSHSFPGDMISGQRDLEWEKGCAGSACSSLDRAPPCVYSINAFGSDALRAYSKPPEFFNPQTKTREWQLPPSTVCVWPYEEMYREEVRSGQGYDAAKRKKFSDEFFSKIEKKNSLIFYYANYSNPFSTDEDRRYVLVGLSRVVEIGDDLYYEGCDSRTLEKYGGYVWDRTEIAVPPLQG
jgi:exodeoxyribonuclease V alpha subunit